MYLMEVSISENVKLGIEKYDSSNLNLNRLILWVWYADKIPPHVGVSFNFKYFSLKATGKDELIELDGVLNLLNKKKITTLGFELLMDSSLQKIENVYSNYSTTIPNDVTCLNPIKEILDVFEVTKLRELLSALNDKSQINKVIGFNVDESFKGIVNYNVNDIHSRLKKLDFAKGK